MTNLDILRAIREDAQHVQRQIEAGVMPEPIDTILCGLDTLIAGEEAKQVPQEKPNRPPHSLLVLEDSAATVQRVNIPNVYEQL